MDLTPDLKARIDALSYDELLAQWRFAKIGSPLFQGDAGRYRTQRMMDLRHEPGGEERHVEASKRIGW